MLRGNTLVADYEYISQSDEAVDSEAEGFELKWKHYLDGMGEPPLKAGETPTIFKLRHLMPTERAYLAEASNGDERGLFIAAAAIALVGVKGFDGPDGKPLEVKQEVTRAGTVKIRSANKATLDALPVGVLFELGALALERGRVRPS
jgi:hypothetical protein